MSTCATTTLTYGICKKICDPSIPISVIIDIKPIVQVIKVQPATINPAHANAQRVTETLWQLIISDGEHRVQVFLQKMLNSLVEEKKIVDNAVIRIGHCTRKLDKG